MKQYVSLANHALTGAGLSLEDYPVESNEDALSIGKGYITIYKDRIYLKRRGRPGGRGKQKGDGYKVITWRYDYGDMGPYACEVEIGTYEAIYDAVIAAVLAIARRNIDSYLGQAELETVRGV